MSALSNIYIGVWTNHIRGPILGKTITLTDAGAVALVSFLAILITHAGSRSFKIVRYAIYQLRHHEAARDGFSRQQDLLLANAETDMGAFGVLIRIAWKWRSVQGTHSFFRSIPLFCIVFLHMVLWLTAGIASSFVADGKDAVVRAKGIECGAWSIPENAKTLAAVREFQRHTMETTTAAQAYVRLCYDTDSSEQDKSECRVLPQRRVDAIPTHNTTCPWPGMCLEGPTSAFTVDTGRVSSSVLGINTAKPLDWQYTLTCAPLVTDSYLELRRNSGSVGEDVYHFNYGPIALLSNDSSSHWVSAYEPATASGVKLNVQTSTPWVGNGLLQLSPIPELRRVDGDVTLVFIGTPGLKFYEPVDDPIFAAHKRIRDFVMPGFEAFPNYEPDNPATVLGCFEQVRICNPRSDTCSNGTSLLVRGGTTAEEDPLYEVVESDEEVSVAILLRYHLIRASVYVAGIALGPNMLAFNDAMFGGAGTVVEREQWKTEVAHFFNLVMAATQIETVRTARTSYPRSHGKLINLLPTEYQHICRMVVFPEPGFTSVSVLGLVVVLVVCALVTILSFGEDKMGRWLVSRWRPYRVKKWTEDGLFQLHRMLCEERGWGTWRGFKEEVPVTKPGERVSTWGNLQEITEVTEAQGPDIEQIGVAAGKQENI